jgi:hypothetical protein
MQGDVETPPGLPDPLEDGFELALPPNVQGQQDGRLELPGQGFDERAGLVVEVGDRQRGPLTPERPGAAVGDRLVVGDADHERFLARERPSDLVSHGSISDLFT